MKSTFVKYLGQAHLNSVNIALYSGGAIRAEHVPTGRSITQRSFDSTDAAQEWFDAMPGADNTSKLASALENLSVGKYTWSKS